LDWLDRLIARRDPTIADTLRHATHSAAERAGRASDLGSIETGKIADMVIVGANPAGNLRALGAVDAVIFRGDVLTRAHLNLLRQGRLKPGDDAGLPRGR
jgi:imidazolonepropionase-like amidohydrolase